MKKGKRYVEAAKLVDRATLYDAADAIALVKKAAAAKFDETVEVHIRTGCYGVLPIARRRVCPHKKIRCQEHSRQSPCCQSYLSFETHFISSSHILTLPISPQLLYYMFFS